MINTKNEHVYHVKGEWMVRREGSKKIFRLFGHKRDAIEYASIIASNDGGSVVSHKKNGQFKKFKHANEIHVRTHKIGPLITGTIEIIHPIVNNTQPVIETITLV